MDGGATLPTVIRESARVLVIDSSDRVLLFLNVGLGDIPTLWVPPGGGVEDGESYEDAGVRELAEEIGLHEATLEKCLWRRNVVVRWGDTMLDSREQWFLVRVDGIDLESHQNPDEVERDLTLGYRWWSLDEIVSATNEVFVPRELGTLLAPLLRGEFPSEPLDIGL